MNEFAKSIEIYNMNITYITLLFKKHKKHLPERFKDTFLGEFCRYGFMIFLSAWLLQGVRISNWREIVIRYSIDFILIATMSLLGIHWALAFFIAHSINFTLNGQLYAMYTHMGATSVNPEQFLNNTIRISKMIEKHKFICASIAYGSLSRGCYRKTSDIDIRLIPAKGGWWRTALYAVYLRAWAFLRGYPLDLYCYESYEVVKKMRSDELPIMVNEREQCMAELYPERVEFEDFIEIFVQTNLNTEYDR